MNINKVAPSLVPAVTAQALNPNAGAKATVQVKPTEVAKDSVSLSKVAQMRAAIENGTFKINPERIVDGLIRSGDLTR